MPTRKKPTAKQRALAASKLAKKRSLAAKKGWETRRRRLAQALEGLDGRNRARVLAVERQKRIVAATKGAKTRRQNKGEKGKPGRKRKSLKQQLRVLRIQNAMWAGAEEGRLAAAALELALEYEVEVRDIYATFGGSPPKNI